MAQKATKFLDPGQHKDTLYMSDGSLLVPRQRRPDDKRTRVWYGLIGSGDMLLKSGQDRDEMRDKYNVVGLEMEAAGVLNEIPVGNIRGVCDYGDEQKNKDWQPYAAAMAAAYAKAVLSEIPPKPPAMSVPLRSEFTDEDRSCLRDLQFTNPEDDRRRIEKTKGEFFEGSFQWILDNAEYREWHNSQHSQTLWIKGDAGKGKTMLIIGVIRELQQQLRESGSSELLAYFLCQGTDGRLNNATAALRGLIYMMIIQQPHLIVHLRKRYDPEGKAPFETANAFYAFSAVFESMIQDINHATVYLLVDALDECKVGQSDLLSLISKAVSIQPAHLKWIVSSRNERLIEHGLNLDDDRSKLSLELNAHHISFAIQKFINHKVSDLDILKDDQSLRDQVKDQLYQKSDGTFLWVALVVNQLSDCEFVDEVLDTLETIPTDLPKLYDQMLEKIDQHKGRRRDIGRTILSNVVFAHRPLHLFEMCHVMNRDKNKVREVKNAVALCGSFLTIRDEYIYLIHQSAKDHLDKIPASTSILKDPSAVHYEIFSRSLQVLSTKLCRNIYCHDNPGASATEIAASSPNPDPLFDLRYSCTYWLDHFLEVQPECVDMVKSVHDIFDFIRRHLLHWLESLGIIGEMRHGILSLRKLVYHRKTGNEPTSIGSGWF
ncbi:NACHT domain-containing protein [Aspergillus keveii]|uniref:NACHT domain-containing protein n=1 Tax=Aspergillus keveii TaxID=714993 RepID=A0ABR4FJC7_9EURO